MDVYALDSNFDLITVAIPYSSLTWTTRYYMAGEFSMDVPVDAYDPEWAYIGSPGRQELGRVQAVVDVSGGNANVTVKGFFCESLLDDKVCYPRHIGDVSKTETAVRTIFTKYKDDIPVELGPANDPLLGDRTQSDFSDDLLGEKIYSILESRELSYRVAYDFDDNRLVFTVWQGTDRTQSGGGDSNVTFSTEFGNIASRQIDLDESAYRNYAIIPIQEDDTGKETKTLYLDWSNGGYRREIVFDKRSSKPEEGQTQAQFEAAILQESAEKLADYAKIEDVDVEVLGAVGYREDYFLGDRVDLVLTDIGLTMESRIVEAVESYTASGGASVSIGLGNKRITSYRRVMATL